MTSLADILHNVTDHTQTLLRLLNGEAVTPDFINKLNQHILLEEQENTSKLQAMQSLKPSAITQKLLDHSYLIQQMMQEEAMPKELKQELLDHFMEEQNAWMTEVSSISNNRQWTVGPLWPQGG